MSSDKNTIFIASAEMEAMLESILVKHGFDTKKAKLCASIFTNSSVDGIYTHGINRFKRFVEYINKGYIRPNEAPSLKKKASNIEQWDGALAPGPLNAIFATNRSVSLAQQNGIGCITLANPKRGGITCPMTSNNEITPSPGRIQPRRTVNRAAGPPARSG